MRKIIGVAGAVLVVVVAIIALVREPPSTARIATAHAADVATVPRTPEPATVVARPVALVEAPTPVDTASAPSATGDAHGAAQTDATAPAPTSSKPSRNIEPAPARGLVMRADLPSRSPGATMSKESIQRAVAAVQPKIRECYEKALAVDPSVEGTVKVNFTLEGKDGKGTVTEGEVADSETASPFFDACVLKEVAGAEFDAPEGGGVVKVTYPFRFSSQP